MSVEENKALLRRFNDAMNGHDIDACATFYAPEAANFGNSVGREGFRTVMTDIFTTFPDWHTTIDEMIAEGDVIATWVPCLRFMRIADPDSFRIARTSIRIGQLRATGLRS